MIICVISYEKAELLTLGLMMYVCLMSYEKTELLTLGDYMSNIPGVLCMYVLCLMRRRNTLPLVTI